MAQENSTINPGRHEPGSFRVYGRPGTELSFDGWDLAVDVVIIGSGGAGLSAAVESSRTGCRVHVLEKMSFPGGNTVISSGAMNAVEAAYHKKRKISSWSVEQFYEWTRMGGDKKNNAGLVRVFAEQTPTAADFLEQIGAPFPEVTHRGAFITHKGGKGLVSLLKDEALKSGATIETGKKVVALVANTENGAKKVSGVCVIDRDGRQINIQAEKAVIIACGGFGANPDMVKKYNPYLHRYISSNLPGASTGECLEMAIALGADTEGIQHIQIHPTLVADRTRPALISEVIRVAGAILVNRDGSRFVDEMQRRDVVAKAISRQESGAAFLVLSRDTAHKKITGYLKRGLAVHAGSVAELSQKAGISPQGLTPTLQRYNRFVETGFDPDFHRGAYREMGLKSSLPGKIMAPDLYAIKVKPGVHHCCGGLRINRNAQVIDASSPGRAIQGLYAAGEATGGIHGTNRMGGNAITECIVFGRIAGKHAAGKVSKPLVG